MKCIGVSVNLREVFHCFTFYRSSTVRCTPLREQSSAVMFIYRFHGVQLSGYYYYLNQICHVESTMATNKRMNEEKTQLIFEENSFVSMT